MVPARRNAITATTPMLQRCRQCFLTHTIMVKLILTLLISFCLTFAFGQIKPKGSFVGLVPIKDFSDPDKLQYKWFHLSNLKFDRDSVYLEQSPVAIYKDDTIYSSSDGGFYNYAGKIETHNGKTIINMTLVSCDYCPNQFIKFIPPKLVKDSGSTQTNDTNTASTKIEPPIIENWSIKYKNIELEKTKSSNTILLDRIIFRRQKKN